MPIPRPRREAPECITDAGHTIRVHLDPALDGQDTPLRRALRQAGLLGPHGLIPPATPADTEDDQED